MRHAGAALSLVALLAIERATPHSADAAPDRDWHGGLGAGGFFALLGPVSTGLAADAELYPGGWFGRFGARVQGRTLDDELGDGADAALLAGGLVYEAAAARPRLAIALHGELGATLPDARPAVGGGIATTLWIAGPLALGLDSTGHVILDGVDSELLLAAALTVRVAR